MKTILIKKILMSKIFKKVVIKAIKVYVAESPSKKDDAILAFIEKLIHGVGENIIEDVKVLYETIKE